jgi:hypothetical protein
VLTEADGAPLAGKTVSFETQIKSRGTLVWVTIGTAITDTSGAAALEVPAKYATDRSGSPLRAGFQGDTSFIASSATALIVRN